MKHTPKKLHISPLGRHLCLFTAVCLVIGVISHVRYADAYDYDKPFSRTVTDSYDNSASESDSRNDNSSRFGSLIPKASAAGIRSVNSTNKDENTLRFYIPRALAAGTESYANSEEEQNITVTKTDTLETAEPGDMIIYRITVTNNTDEPISNVTITDFMPSFGNPTAATPVAQIQDSVVWWENQTVPPGETIFYVRVHIDENAPDGVLLENRAEVSGQNISLSATDTTLIMRPAVPQPVAPTVDTGTGIGLLLITAAAVAVGGATTIRRFLRR